MGSIVKLAIVGDVVPAETLPSDPAVTRALAILQRADFALGNLETVASQHGAPVEKLYNIRVDPRSIDELHRVGIGLVSVANNHALDYGVEGFLDTIRLLAEAGILSIGGGMNLREAWEPVIVSREGIRIAFLGAASTLPPGFAAGEARPGIAPIHVTETYETDPTISLEQPGSAPYVHTKTWPEDVETAQAAIREAKSKADFAVVAIHWGVPPLWRAPSQGELAEYQRPLGHGLIEAGADLVVGHHPHCLQGVEVYQGKPIFYSLGNFIFGSHVGDPYPPLARNVPYNFQDKPDCQWSESVILDVTVSSDGVASYEAWPVFLSLAGHPCLLEAEHARAVVGRLAAMSEPLGGVVAFEEGRGRLSL